MNWKLLIFDFLAIVWIVITVLIWQDREDIQKFGDIVMGACIFFWRLDAHYTFYKKERRFY